MLTTGLLAIVTPIRHSATVKVRVDKAPSFKSLATRNHTDLMDNNIELILADDENKNSNCVVDKIIQELEVEIRKLVLKEIPISPGTLAKAVDILNNRIRGQGLTSSQIHFSRDSITGTNLFLNDENLISSKAMKRKENNISSAKSKAPAGKPPPDLQVKKGDFVYVTGSGSKHEVRDPHLVTRMVKNKVSTKKILNSYQEYRKTIKNFTI